MDLKSLSNEELKELKRKTEYEVSKYENIQLAKKVQLNSAYGALGNEYFRFFDIRQAEAVTLSGQLVIRWVEKYVNAFMNKLFHTDTDYVIASDTDSVYVKLDSFVERIYKGNIPETEKVIKNLDKICKEIFENLFEKAFKDLAEYTNAFQRMVMKREVLADSAVWTAKKRYAINVYNSEGVQYTEPKVKIMGLESVKSSTPEVCREKIKKVTELVLRGTQEDVFEFVKQFREDFMKLRPEEIAFPRGVNGLEKYTKLTRDDFVQRVDGWYTVPRNEKYKKGTPIHVNGSLLYNRLLKAKKLEKKYQTIHEGDKIKFMYLKEPNPVSSYVISIMDVLPEEFGLKDYVDYETQFEKSFLAPIDPLVKAAGWKSEYEANLDEFFM